MEDRIPYYIHLENALCVPEYYQEHIASAAERINAARAGGNPIFAFATDIHIYAASMSFVSLLPVLADRCGLRDVFIGGDLPWAFGTKDECLNDGAITLQLMNALSPRMNTYVLRGNHDFTIRTSWEDTSGYTAPYDLTVRMLMRTLPPQAVRPEGEAYYYVDDPAQKIRYIALDTCSRHIRGEDQSWGTCYGFDPEQREWLAGTALRCPDSGKGWTVIALAHVPCVKALPSYSEKLDDLAAILIDFKHHRAGRFGDFTGEKAEFAACICGHNHVDQSAVQDGTLFISTSSSCCLQDDVWHRMLGTVTEELFDVFVLDKENRTLNAVRVGAGVDRSFTY